MHVHYFPARVFAAIWEFFERSSHGLWPVRYKLSGQSLIDVLLEHGTTRLTTLVYAHKAGMADSLNEFVADEARRHSELIPFGTVFAGDGDVERRALRLFDDYGFLGVKLHPFVSNEELDDARFFPLYEVMEERGKIVVCHPGSAPVYGRTDGVERVDAVARRFPRLKLVIAHCGALEYEAYADLAERHHSIYFDTAMNCVETNVFPHSSPGAAFFARFPERILFGSDFPNIPYAYGLQADALQKMGLAMDVVGRVNAERLLGFT